MSNLYWLSQITIAEKLLVGEKAFLLSQLLQDNFPIVPGFVLDRSFFQTFLATLDPERFLISSLSQSDLHLNTDNYQALQSVANTSRRTIIEAIFSEVLREKIFIAAQKLNSSQLILRPSLIIPHYQNQSNHALLQSSICSCNPHAIVRGIKQIWADLFSAKSLLYWDKSGINIQKIDCAILIQPIQNAIASGVVEIQNQQATINANWGLGHSLQRGEVDPDRYVVDLLTTNIVNQIVNCKTHGYRLKKEIPTDESTAILESYWLEDSDQEKKVLEPLQINSLIQFIIDIVNKNPHINHFEWILFPETTNSSSCNFFFTQVSCQTATLEQTENISFNKTNLENRSQSILLRGVAAARGTVTARVIVNSATSKDRSFTEPNIRRQSIEVGAILVTKTIQPQDIPLLQNLGGIITEVGGQTSHGAILARELGIPAVVSATNGVEVLKTGDFVTLDGDRGLVYDAFPNAAATEQNKQKKATLEYYTHDKKGDVPLATQLMVNLSQPKLIEQTKKLPIDGVGLLRSEFLLLELLSQRSLEEWLQPNYQTQLVEYLTTNIRKFTLGFPSQPIYYRSLDFPVPDSQGKSFVLGIRGTFAYLIEPTFFQLELKALAKVMAEGQSNVKLILPFVRSIQEWQFCQNLVEKSGLTRYSNFQLWLMAEIPSVMLMLPEYIAAGVQGIAIGTNDLTQLLLGIDREQASFARQGLNSNSLAVERAIYQLINTAHNHQIPCSICLSTNHCDRELIAKLVSWGIDTISVEAQTVIDTYKAIAKAEKRQLLKIGIQQENF